ncbi:PAS domain-containing protein [Sphingobacterium alkalisoli]|uniref:PAS domain-containing protein n=1 Tax=Sphingobacterium alkalisoli TaxID=1874115 RepID=A0A4U0GWI3_9SPHI|nr:PAS domain-containing protein [Sphingobacterium alkalisoli]TJY63443.1 PAS domain-containing protein [Sphingobacterium alkalisoli]GGH26099.1 hypothetical protein GCM10011418_35120 [Sphingobacterium alkalisoli]
MALSDEILDLIPIACFHLDNTGIIKYINRSALELLGRTKMDCLGRTISEIFPDSTINDFSIPIKAALEDHKTATLDYVSQDRWIRLTATPTKSGVIVSFTELSAPERGTVSTKKTIRTLLDKTDNDLSIHSKTPNTSAVDEQELIRVHEKMDQWTKTKYLSLFNKINQGFCIVEVLFDPDDNPIDYKFLEVNPAFEAQTGLHQVAGNTMRNLKPEHEEYWFRIYGEIAKTGIPQHFEEEAAALGRWYDVYAYRMEPPNKNHVAILFNDITERKNIEKTIRENEVQYRQLLEHTVIERTTELRQTKDLLQATLDSSLDMIQVFKALRDEQGKIIDFIWILVNQAAEKIYGGIMGERLLQRNPGVLHTGIFQHFVDVVESGVAQQYEMNYTYEQFDGWFHQSVVKLGDGVACTTADITARKLADEALTKSYHLMQSVFDASLIQMSVLEAIRDINGNITDFQIKIVNRKLESETKRTDLVGKLYAEEYPGIKSSGLFNVMLRVMQTGKPEGLEYYYPYDGFRKWFSCMFVKSGNGLVATNIDITERKQREEERFNHYLLLQQSEELAKSGSWDLDLENDVFTWSDGMYKLFDLTKNTYIRPEIYLDYATPKSRPIAKKIVRCLYKGNAEFEETLEIRIGDQIKLLHLKATVVSNQEKRPIRILGVTIDITAVHEAENKIRRLAEQRQQEILQAILNTQEEERQRISESLHNGLAQLLYGTKLSLDYLTSKLALEKPEIFNYSKKYTGDLLSDAIKENRRISHELMPTVLTEFGLNAAIQDVCNQLKDGLKLKCNLSLGDIKLDKYLELAIFRTVQELMINVVKHAKATAAEVNLVIKNSGVRILVSDNGKGITATNNDQHGIGLSSIRNKVDLLKGSINIESPYKKGTKIEVWLPLQTSQDYNPE